jgi:putative transposase
MCGRNRLCGSDEARNGPVCERELVPILLKSEEDGLRRMVRGVSTRDYANVIDLTRDGFGVQKSSVSRDFVRASAAQVKALAEHRFDGMHFPVLLIDGVEYAGETMSVAAGITADGTQRVLGLRQGATENAAVCVALLEDLQARGLDTRGSLKAEG